jgi:glycosyltransferase involved in cell wall biosynthesis
MPLLFAGPLRHSNLLKSNQVKGADTALRAARFWRKPLIARCGYLWSTFAVNKNGEPVFPAADYARAVERKVFGAAAGIIVTTELMSQDIGRRFPDVRGRIAVIPNYVDTELFRPAQQHEVEQELIFVGRLTEQKNVAALIEAANRLRVRLLIIGDGDCRDVLEQRYGDADGRIRWKGIVPHAELPSYLHRSAVFVLPSHYEGHPKTLIEAMACGLPVIGSDTPGIRDVIQHGENGWRCGTDPESIAAAIRQLLADAALRSRLGRNARAYAVREYALDRVVDRELALYRKVVPVPSP